MFVIPVTEETAAEVIIDGLPCNHQWVFILRDI
jgi:hypothetical protein